MSLPIGLLLAAALAPRPVTDFELRDSADMPCRLSAVANGRPTVVVFLGVDCPMASLYAGRLNELAGRFPAGAVAVLGIAPNRGDDRPALAAFARDHRLTFPLLRDPDGRVAGLFGATRSPHAFVLDADRRVRYRGRIDDQYGPVGKNRGGPTREDLVEAVRDVLAGRPVSVPATECTGCFLSRPRPAAEPRVTYSRDVAPILAAHCRVCHRPGEVGPFALLSYADAAGHAETIAAAVADGTMPPWHASPAHGRFRNERRLSEEQKGVVAAWVRAGCPEGGPLPPAEPPPAGGWRIGPPDAVFRIPREFAVPAEGVVEYQHFVVETGFTTDAWASAIEVRPGNRRVVHHCSVFLHPPSAGGTDEYYATGALGSVALGGFAAGGAPLHLRPGRAKRIPAGWRLHFVLHYAPVGTPQSDRTEIGLRLLDPRAVRKEVATKVVVVDDLAIPPGAADYRAARTWTAPHDVLLLSMAPHMHLRGKSFRYTAAYPDGTSEVLLDVPRYDFNWQHGYELTEPKRLPAGTVLRCDAVYDNSAANPFNPDPAATVVTGEQTSDEMFNGYFDVALADQDMAAERAAADRVRARSAWSLAGVAGLSAVAGLWLWRKRRGAAHPGPSVVSARS
jgi:peroxiredoxin/mono/diheme cytochrome c family protein